MSVKQGLLALLADRPMYGAQLRAEFEARTGGTWPLNVGQVYTTLSRLERDGLVEPLGAADDEGKISYHLTRAGKAQVEGWWTSPVARDSTPRGELVIKLALAVTVPGVDVRGVVQTQRAATITHLQELTKLKRASPTSGGVSEGHSDLAWSLVLENLIFTCEAEVRWLDHVEARLKRVGERPAAAAPAQTSTEQDVSR